MALTGTELDILTVAREVTGRPLAGPHEGLQPEVTEALGQALAGRLRESAPEAVVLWCDPRAVVLGHVVARELGAELVLAYSDLGILSLSTTLRPGTRAALVDYVWETDPCVVPLLTMVGHSADVVAVASVLNPPESLRDSDIGSAALMTLSTPSPRR
ncbi:hypothetical protein [Nocardia sp. JMUB6875]|uniref:hypothetical protein n=1 Tax=Nocardia sp. JMUB6875 TaxID=3158170 RepID=UPI0034E86B73